MRKYGICLLLMAAVLLQSAAFAAPEWTGSVVSGRTFAVYAAYGGTVSELFAEVGDALQAGDALLQLSGEKVYAPCDGTVSAVFAGAEDNADTAVEKYGAAMAIEPTEKFLVYVTAEEQFFADDTRRVSLGETVYLRCTEDSTHRGFGRVIEADGLEYTVEIDGGQFSNGEVVYAGLQEGFTKSQRAGIGTVLAAEAVSVSATGMVVRTHIGAGEPVEAGQLLMETAGGVFNGTEWNDGLLSLNEGGIVLSVNVSVGDTVEQGQLVAVVADAADLYVEISLPEEDIAWLPEQTQTRLQIEDGMAMDGEVVFSSRVADDNGCYAVLIRPTDCAGLRLGQTVCARLPEDN